MLEPIAAWFSSLGIPEPIVHWGHPLMMAIVVFVMGSFVGFVGWRGRIVKDKDVLRLRVRLLPSINYTLALLVRTVREMVKLLLSPLLPMPHLVN